MPAPHHSRPDALPAAQPTASKHWRQCYRERKCAENYDKWYSQNFGSFLRAGCPSCVSGEGSWIIINDMTEMTNIWSEAIMFLLHQVSYTLAHTVRNFCCYCVSRSRFVCTSISYFVAGFFAFCCEIRCCYRFYTDTIKMCRHQNVASYFCGCRFFLFLCYFSGHHESKGVKLQIYFFLGRET